jgi:hypothetical protein
MGEERSANLAHSHGVDSNWYADSRATDHVTRELDKLAIKEPYHGDDQIYTSSDSGMAYQAHWSFFDSYSIP